MSIRTYGILRTASAAAYVVAAAALLGLVTIVLFFWLGAPWGGINDLSGVLMTIALAPTMLAFYELGGRTPTPLAVLAQSVGWVAVIGWAVIHALMFVDVVTFDYSAPATGAMALEQVALIVIGLWIAGANLLAGEWLSWIRWLGVVTGLGFALLGAGLLLGGESHPLSYLGGTAYELVLPIWAFWMARLFGRIAGLR